jgi:hypothetical protein
LKRIEGEARAFVGVPDLNKAAISILGELGFRQYSYSIRMRLAKELDVSELTAYLGSAVQRRDSGGS